MYAETWPIRVTRIARRLTDEAVLTNLLSIFFITFLAAPFAWAMPPVLEPTATLRAPDPRFTETESVAIDGDYAVVGFAAEEWDMEEDEFLVTHVAVVYRRASNGSWQHMQTLAPVSYLAEFRRPGYVAIRGNVIAHIVGELYVFERTASGWQPSPVQPLALGGAAFDLDIDSGTIVVATLTCSNAQAEAFRKNASGTWVRVGVAASAPVSCDGGSYALAAISGNTTLLAAPRLNDGTAATYFFNGAPATWTAPAQTVSYPIGQGVPIAIAGSLAILNGSELYRRSAGIWSFSQRLEREEFGVPAAEAKISGTLAALLFNRVISVFDLSTSGAATEIARLTRPGGEIGALTLDISGRRVIALDAFRDQGAAYVFEVPSTLPSQPSMIQDTFQSGNASRWTPLAGGSWSVATTPASRVYRQSSLAADATSVLSNSDWTDQSIQADIRPTAFSGNDRWFGLAVRRLDAANYYYVTARSSGVVQLKRMVNGVFQTLASANLPVTAGADYRIRLEAIGTTITAYVNGVALLNAVDASLSHGQAALLMYKTAADYDNVIVTPSPQATLFSESDFIREALWTRVAGQWSVPLFPAEPMHFQTSTAGGASSFTGHSSTDQSIYARLRQDAVGTGTQPWFGLFVRYRDASNYYYVTVRNSNEISLRRLVNGVTQVLDSAPFTVSTGTWYPLRLEAIRDQLRVYVGNRLVLEATDSAISEGRYGAVMYKSATTYDDVVVTQP
ncbi:hypothetical protein JM946_08630 [Steroidobacter sp. S1-65]|uniref:DUF1080 domain-containing protein n=1 Tax=Steroidobacter gossypii TaxID=2805490 RepID=A0ABS1WV08_9GAMM|nr:hypothetical protein [Steroidobacter gossypii]MBM0104811.1 hypothetical protein [Steroidobacter gossypii]